MAKPSIPEIENDTTGTHTAEQAVVSAEPPAAYPKPTEVAATGDFRRYAFLIGLGLFVTTMAQPNIIGNLPFKFLFKNELHMKPVQMAAFWAVSNMAWYFKPIAGFLCDSVPIFGTRRKWYLMLSAAFGTCLWILYAFLPHSYSPFLWTTVALAVMMVFASTVTGGLLVEEGQKFGAIGRLSSIRMGIEGIIGLIVGPIGGYLAAQKFGLTVGIGAALMFTLVPAAIFLLNEPPVAKRNTKVWADAGAQLKNVFASHTMWAAAGLLFLVYIAPGFGTPLFFYQTDTLKFSPAFIGSLGFLSGVGGLIGAVLYGFYCKKLALRPLLTLGILFNVASTLFYLGYRSPEAARIIEFGNGLFGTLAVIPLFDLAARATPKGSESFGYALMMSVRNITAIAISDVLGSWLFEKQHWQFHSLVWLNAGTTALVLLAVPFLPRALMQQRDGETLQGKTA